jgi:hypothetical protein
MNRYAPSPAARVNKRDGDLIAAMALGDESRDPACGLFIGY